MIAAKLEADLHEKPTDHSTAEPNASPRIKSPDFARRVRAAVAGWPSSLEAQMKRRPYATVGMAVAIGMGGGIILGSRILRSLVVSTASYAAMELGRTYLRRLATGAS